jgi:hypothetical protein
MEIDKAIREAIEIVEKIRIDAAPGPTPIWHKLLRIARYLEKQEAELYAEILN